MSAGRRHEPAAPIDWRWWRTWRAGEIATETRFMPPTGKHYGAWQVGEGE